MQQGQGRIHEGPIVTAKMYNVDPQAWQADALAHLPNMPVSWLRELLP